MKHLTRNEGDNVQMLELQLLESVESIQKLYWESHKTITNKEYESRAEQETDMRSLGRLADSLHHARQAVAALQQIPRY